MRTGTGSGTISPALAYAEQTCSDVIATNGGILRYCQNARTLDIYESGVNMRSPSPQARLVDDPQVLSALQSELSLRPEFAASRHFIARSCLVGDKRYLTVSVESLKRILHGSARRITFRDEEPFVTGAITPRETQMPDPR